MNWLSDALAALRDNMTTGEKAMLLGLLAIIAGGIIIPLLGTQKRRREFRDRDARYRHLQDI